MDKDETIGEVRDEHFAKSIPFVKKGRFDLIEGKRFTKKLPKQCMLEFHTGSIDGISIQSDKISCRLFDFVKDLRIVKG